VQTDATVKRLLWSLESSIFLDQDGELELGIDVINDGIVGNGLERCDACGDTVQAITVVDKDPSRSFS
jgi:hypothetical protein